MKTNFLSLLFFCGVCVSAFGQELQSPQINQNAIFANPGLAGSKGQTRVCANMGRMLYGKSSDKYHRNLTNGLISIDGLILKKSIGFGAYVKFNNYNYYNYSPYNNLGQYNVYKYTTEHKYDLTYSNIETGIMVAPKFYLTSSKVGKQNRCISPSISFGLRGNFAKLNSYYNYANTSYSPLDSVVSTNSNYSSIELSHITFGFLYNTEKGYSGIKQSFNHIDEGGFNYKTSFVFAHTYCNRKVENPKFSFSPQIYLGITYPFSYNSKKYKSPYHVYWQSDFSINLDFRYKLIICGLYTFASNWNYYSSGYTLGVQLKTARILLNIQPAFDKRDYDPNFFITTNFYIKTKKERY